MVMVLFKKQSKVELIVTLSSVCSSLVYENNIIDQSRSNIRVQSDNYELKSEDNEIQYHVSIKIN